MTNKPNVLIVDDEVFVRDLLSDVLARRGYQITACNSAAEALNVFRENEFSLVMLDASLPDMDAVEALTRLRVLDMQVPVVMMVATGYEPDHDLLAGLGALLLPKPFSISLLNSVIEVMERKRQEWLEAQATGVAPDKPLTGSGQDRRRHLRATVNLHASVVSHEESRECKIIDISLGGGGLHFMLEEVFPVGTEVNIIFPTLPHEEPLSLPARIVWENRATGHCGASFRDLDWRNARRLEAIIAEAILG